MTGFRKAVGWLLTVCVALAAAVSRSLATLLPETPRAPTVFKFSCHPFVKRGWSRVVDGGGNGSGIARLAAVALAVLIFASIAHVTTAGGYALAIVAAVTRDLKTVLAELAEFQSKTKGRALTTEEGTQWDTLSAEAKAMQDEGDRDKFVRDLEQKGREVPAPRLPGSTSAADFDTKTLLNGADDEIVGMFSLGQMFVRSPEYVKGVIDRGGAVPEGQVIPVEFRGSSILGVKQRGIRGGAVPITRKMYKDLLERKAIPTIGTGVIRVDRDPELVRAAAAEFDRLTIRDLVTQGRTGSNSVDYIAFDSLTRAAAPVAENAAKPEATMAMSEATSPVRTLAVWMPVTEQQLADVEQIEDIIDDELRYDLAKLEEEQLVWGRGTGQNLLGIMKTTGVVAGRTVGGDTLLDKIRRALSDIQVNGRVNPNGVAIHPFDWEAVVLLKGTDARYVWTVVTGEAGSRIWGLNVVETIAMTDVLDVTNTTKQRVVLVGDFRRGAKLWDRLQAQVQVGWQNDDFTKNRRTIRAEERIAFAVRRPKAFAFVETVAAAP